MNRPSPNAGGHIPPDDGIEPPCDSTGREGAPEERRFVARLFAIALAGAIWPLAVQGSLFGDECHDVHFLADPVVDVDSDVGEIGVSWTTLFDSDAAVIGESHVFTNRVSLWSPGGSAAGARGPIRESVLTMGPGGLAVSEFVFDGLEPGTHTLVVHLDLFDDVEECGTPAAEQADNKFSGSFDIVEQP